MIRYKPSQQLCDDDKLIAVLRDGDQAAHHQEVVEHIEQCSRCQQRFDELAAGAQDWTKARQALINDDPGSENAVGSAKWNYSLRNEGPVAWTESMASQLLSPASHPELLGRIGRYDVERLIGSGGMGVVFKANDSELNRPVAIKILAPYLSSSGPARKRFAREARAAAAVVHEHVVPIYNVETERETPFLVMHYIAGESLQGRIDRGGALELCEILRIGMQVASGLSAAHQQGLVHRDIKPSNILMEQGVERALITDFGLARAADDGSLTRTGFHPGTPQYMSPEQAAGEQVDHRSDLFSLGSVLYTMCTGRPPFRAETSLGVLRRITDVEPRPIREINPDIPEWLCAIISKLMAKQASDRFASAQEVAKLLEDCLAHVQQPTVAALPPGLVDKSVPPVFSFRSRTIGVFVMFAVVGSIVVAMLLMQLPDKTNEDGGGDVGGVQVASTDQADAHDAGIAKLTELLEMQKLREKSVRQLRLLGNIRQTQQIETKRIEGESNEEYIKRYTSPERTFDGLGPFPMLVERDYNADSGHVRYGDLNGKLPLMFREWFFNRDVFTQLMGVEDGHGQATITKKPADELRQPWSGWIRADVYAFRPILDHELSVVLEKAAHTPGIPDPAGRPLFHLHKKKSADQKVQWIATFLHQEPSEINGRTAVEQLWYRVFWEQVDKELLITRVDELSVVGSADSMPLRVALVDDYRKIDGVSMPHRVRTYMFANPSGMLGAEFVASEVKVNEGFVMPKQLQIPAGTSVTDELTGKRYRQPVDESKSHQDSLKAPTGNSESTTINPDIPAEGKPIDKDKLLNEFRERDRKFSRRTIELERTWDTLTSPRGMAAEGQFQSLKFGQPAPGIPEGLPEDYQQPHRIRYIWTGQNFESTLEILADLEKAIHPEHGKLESRSIESDCFNYYRYWNRDLEIFSHSSDITKLGGGKKAWEYLLPSGIGFTQSILSVSNAVEADDGYVLKGLISLPSATIGNRKNCFEIHLDKEMILRKAVIQYHVYDFVIVTAGRSKFDGLPPLAKHAAISIHHIGQDEKRSGDVGNYKYELISLSEKLSKAEYDLRVNFAIPKGTKLSAGLNLVEVNLQGLPGVTQVERDAPAPRPEMTPRETDQTSLDRRNTNEIVRVLMKAALEGDSETTKTLTRELPQKVTAELSSLASENEMNELHMEFDTLEDFLKPGKDLFDKEMKQIDKRLVTVLEGSAEHSLLTTKKKQLQQQWDLSVAQVKGMAASAKAGQPVQLAPIVIPNNARPWQAPMPDPLPGHDEDIAKVLAGTWQLKRCVGDGEEASFEGSTVTFSKNRMIMYLKVGDEEREMQMTYRIGNDKIDIWDMDSGPEIRTALPHLGSYSIENDTLRICYHDSPMALETPQSRPPIQPANWLIYWELQRDPIAEKVEIAKGKTDDLRSGQSYKIKLLVLANDDLKPVSGATVEVTLIGDDGGDGGFADFKTDEDGIATIDNSLWPGRYQIQVRAPKHSRYRDTEYSKDESILVVHKDGRYSPREFRLVVDDNNSTK